MRKFGPFGIVKLGKIHIFHILEPIFYKKGHISKRLKIELVPQFWPKLVKIWFEGSLGGKF